MSTGSWTLEIESPVAAPRLFKAALLDWHALGPKVVPEIVVSGEILEGGAAVGSLRQLNFTSALPFSHVKERLNYLDLENYEVKQTLEEGGEIGTKLETATTHYKFEPTANGGCVVKVKAEYKLLPGVDDQGDVEKAKANVTGIIKAAEGYLLAHPDLFPKFAKAKIRRPQTNWIKD